mgnify:CR=1 FL=1
MNIRAKITEGAIEPEQLHLGLPLSDVTIAEALKPDYAINSDSGGGRADAMDVLKRDLHALVGRDVDASNTGHEILQIRVSQTQQTLRLTNQERGALRGKAPLYR